MRASELAHPNAVAAAGGEGIEKSAMLGIDRDRDRRLQTILARSFFGFRWQIEMRRKMETQRPVETAAARGNRQRWPSAFSIDDFH